jgi:threonine synthase
VRPIKYYSTNRRSPTVSFEEALALGLAPDRGLYLPEAMPHFEAGEILAWKERKYWEIAFEVTRPFLGGSVDERALRKMCREAYCFDVPLERPCGRKYVMRLDRGPTASFKDFAAGLMAGLVEFFLKNNNKSLAVLAATSGDTGSAVAHAFSGAKNTRVVVLFPEKEVSERQRKQMTTLGENVAAVAVRGKFDDCQAMVKRAFADPALKHLNLSSANSINIGRLIPQVVYYFYAFARLAESEQDSIVFSVPSGNFGNTCAGIIAMKMGLPVQRIIAAPNENDEFPRFMRTGNYKKIVPAKNCISNSMNVGHPSNLARIIDIYGGRMDENGALSRPPDMESMRREIFAVSITDERTLETMRQVHDEFGLTLEPHGAVGWAGLQELPGRKEGELCVSLETAHPSKFPAAIERALGFRPKAIECPAGATEKEESFAILENDYSAFRRLLESMV